MTTSLDKFAGIVGPANVLTGDDAAPYLEDWTGAYSGEAKAVIRPGSTAEVAAVVNAARDGGLTITIQSGNTSVSGGSVPVRSGGIILSMARMNRIRQIDPAARTATVDAGVIIQSLQDEVAAHGLDFPLMFGARGSALIGGALATNAGGANVLRYGSARELCLGIEAVLPNGQIIDDLAGLRKDNTGYDLKNLLISSEGTLGVITGAVLKLSPTPKARATAFLALSGMDAALDVLNALQDASGGLVEAFEWLPGEMTTAILANDLNLRAPLAQVAETGVLVELASTRNDDAEAGDDGSVRLQAVMLDVIEALMERGNVIDGFFATSEQQRIDLWAVREAVLETIRAQGRYTSLDAALPISDVAEFLNRARPLTTSAGLRPMLVGHLGDGNIHYAVTATQGEAWDQTAVDAWETAMLDLLLDMGGTFSAEHGIGRAKAHVLAARKDPAQFDAMQAIKSALDCDNLMNPGIVFPTN